MSEHRAIWKFPLELRGVPPSCQVSMPAGASIVRVAWQRDVLCAWAIVDPEADKQLRSFIVVPTGPPGFAAGMVHYIATYDEGPFVFHLMGWEPNPGHD